MKFKEKVLEQIEESNRNDFHFPEKGGPSFLASMLVHRCVELWNKDNSFGLFKTVLFEKNLSDEQIIYRTQRACQASDKLCIIVGGLLLELSLPERERAYEMLMNSIKEFKKTE